VNVIPVIDILDGHAVAAVRGERATYRPVVSKIVDNAKPHTVASALIATTQCSTMYVADLNAIQGKKGHWDQLKELASSVPVELIVDVGVSSPEDAISLMNLGVGRVIIGTETLPDIATLEQIVNILGKEHVLISLDVRNGRILTEAAELASLSPIDGLKRLIDMGFDQFIILTLSSVGTGAGPDWPLLEKAAARFPDASLFLGGGVSDIADLQKATKLGLDGALVATALHEGWITHDDLKEL